MRKELSSGAESIIYIDKDPKESRIIKDRVPKNYRIPEIDNPLRNFRTRREAKIIEKLSRLGMNVPKLKKIADNVLEMEFIEGDQLKIILDTHPILAMLVGRNLTMMHDNDIIHGDLTTSNMILKGKELYFIDFGLSFFSKRIEDKAVDIHLFKQALESKHYKVCDKAFKYFLETYSAKDKKLILERLSEVESRGRYKEKI